MIQIGDRKFSFKREALDYFQRVLHETPLDEAVSPEAQELLIALLRRHPNVKSKLGSGVLQITVGRNSYGGRNFQILRTDGTLEPFSYKKAIVEYNPAADLRRRVTQAFRQEVLDQTQAIKSAAIGTLCPLSGHCLEWEIIDVDHIGKDFADILQEFLLIKKTTLEELDYTESSSGDIFLLKNRALASEWRTWHETHSQLQAVHRDAHRSKEGFRIQPLHQTYLTGSQRLNPKTSDLFK